MVGKHGSPLERFERHYIPEPMSGCWLWTGSVHKAHGYAQLAMPGGTPVRAHRLSYQLFKGKIPKGLDVRHTCDIRCCVNPDHLLVGTRKQNMDDAESRGRIARGFKLPHTKLSNGQRSAIIIDPRPYKIIALKYGVSSAYVCALKTRHGAGRYKDKKIVTPWGHLTLTAAAKKANVKYGTLFYRIKNNWPRKHWFIRADSTNNYGLRRR